MPSVIEQLVAIVGEHRVKVDDDAKQVFGKDQTRVFTPNPIAVVFPDSTEEVQKIVQLANHLRIAIVPSGGRTGLSGGAVAMNGEIVLSLEKMNRVVDYLPEDRILRVEAGMITEQLQTIAEEKGLFYPVDFGSSGSSQIGGNIATNAGGIKVIRYGMTRNWVLGLTVVTGSGEVLEVNHGMMKNATGYALQHLFIGSEGTLGIITEAHMKLERQPQNLQVLVLGVPNFEAVMPVMREFRAQIDLTAFEFFDANAMQKVVDCGHVSAPFATPAPFYVLLEFESPNEQTLNQAMEVFEACMEKGWVLDGVLSQSLEQMKNLWRLREDITESLSGYTTNKNDISVLIGHVPAFINDIEQFFAQHYAAFETCWFGHIGDGNLHLNVVKPQGMPIPEFYELCRVINPKIFELVAKYGGSISAEHGVGLTKKPYLEYSRSHAEVEYMRGIKQLFDPNHILNPGKIFDMA